MSSSPLRPALLACLVALGAPLLLSAGCGDDTTTLDMTAALDMAAKSDAKAGCEMVTTWPSDDVTVYGDVEDVADYTFSTIGAAARTTGAQTDELDIEVWHSPTTPAFPRTVTLPADGSYLTCDVCVLVYEDLDDNGDWGAVYFARGGTVNITKADKTQPTGSFAATATNLQLVEWDLEDDKPVPNGKCYSVGSATINGGYTVDNADGGTI